MQLIRVVVASPGDVQAERDYLPAVIEEINSGIAKDREVYLELARWETDAFPGFHLQGPQGLIDTILRIDDCDVLIGIFWKRFGTPTMEAQSGTEHEFRLAYAAWQQHQRPRIMMYFNQERYNLHHITADIAEDKLVQALLSLRQNPDARPGRLIEYLRDRAGLLEPRGVGIYAFPHRTFQEYLAACHLTDAGFPDELAQLLLAEPNRWREVTLLAGAKAARGTASAAWTLAEALCDKAPPRRPAKNVAGYWGALLAAQVLLENKSLAPPLAECHQAKIERIRTWLIRTLRHNTLPPGDRAQAGDVLAQLGDTRFRWSEAWYLPNEPLLGFVEIPAGPFLMGSDDDIDSLAGWAYNLAK